jgi:3-hydroxyacyl-CoA dehydrogenase
MSMSQIVQTQQLGSVTVLTVDNPPVNALSHAMRSELLETLHAAEADARTQAIVLVCAGRTFIAGADISEFGKPPREPSLHEILDVIENATKPVVAAIHGTALGGGLEVALACHYRVGLSSARFGLPEVTLGLIPGAGGTQRLPRVVGVDKALQMVTSGSMIGAAEALQTGLIDEIIEGDLADRAVEFARDVASVRPLPRVREREDRIAEARGRPEIFQEFRKSMARRSRGFVAPEAAVRAVEAAVNLPFDEGLERERQLFAGLMAGEQSKAQRYFFFAERSAAKIPGLDSHASIVPIKRVAVIGAGTMGGGISMALANASIAVTLVEQEQQFLDRGLAIVRKNWEATAARGGLTHDQVEERMGRITATLDFADIAEADLVIEAVYESMPVKKEVFGRIDRCAKPEAVLATNTSSLDIDEIARSTSRPEQVIGTHFFSPANIMRLLEVVRGARTSDSVIATAMDLGKKIGKVAVLVRVCDGFVGNRILFARNDQADDLLKAGALPQQIDKVIYEFGLPMGPYAMLDMANGIELEWRLRQTTGEKEFIGDSLAELGRFGQKTNKGYYRYEPGNRTPIPDPEAEAVFFEASRREGIQRRDVSDQEIVDRLTYMMINEGARILEEGIAIRPSDIDVIWVTGYGWPTYRGGPMFYADSIGVKQVRDKLRELEAQYGAAFKPAVLLERMADQGQSFANWDELKGEPRPVAAAVA